MQIDRFDLFHRAEALKVEADKAEKPREDHGSIELKACTLTTLEVEGDKLCNLGEELSLPDD